MRFRHRRPEVDPEQLLATARQQNVAMWLSWIESQTGVPVTEDDVEWAYIGEGAITATEIKLWPGGP